MISANDPQMAAKAWSRLAGPGASTACQAARLDSASCQQNMVSRASAAAATNNPRVHGVDNLRRRGCEFTVPPILNQHLMTFDVFRCHLMTFDVHQCRWGSTSRPEGRQICG
jgi:hypothetical protein